MELLTKFKELEAKQKLTVVLTAVIAVFALYLAYDTFFGGTTGEPVSVSAPVAAEPSVAKTPKRMSVTNNEEENGAPAVTPAPEQKQPTPAQLAVLAQSQQMQQQYVNLVNAYQMAQIEQKLAAANSQIAQAKLSTAKAMVSTQDYVAKLPRGGGVDDDASQAPQAVYIGQQNGRWLAMLSMGGNYVQVNVGTRLPDGSVVSSISDRGVILDKNGEPSYLPIAKSMQ